MKTQNTQFDAYFISEVRKEIQPKFFKMQKSVRNYLRDKDLCYEEDSPLCKMFKREIVDILAKYQELFYQQPDGVTCLCADPEGYAIINCAISIERKIDEWYNEGSASYDGPWVEGEDEEDVSKEMNFFNDASELPF